MEKRAQNKKVDLFYILGIFFFLLQQNSRKLNEEHNGKLWNEVKENDLSQISLLILSKASEASFLTGP